MLGKRIWLSPDDRKLITLTVLFALSTILGCSGGEESNPITSNLHTTASSESDDTSTNTNVAPLPDDEEALVEASLDARPPIPEEGDPSLTADSQPASTESDSEEEQVAENPPPQTPTGPPMVALHSTPTGASADVTWQPSADSNVSGYYIHYGRQSPVEPGVCSYEERYAAESPSVTITDLEPNTPYFFAVSSYSSFESPCSNEIAVITPPAGA